MKNILEYTDSTRFVQSPSRQMGGSPDWARRYDYFKPLNALPSFPYIDDESANGDPYIDELSSIVDDMDNRVESDIYQYPFNGYKSGKDFENNIHQNKSQREINSIPSQASGGGRSNSNMPAGMNSPGWASAPRNGKKDSDRDIIKDFLAKYF